jgi:hypothetical protein
MQGICPCHHRTGDENRSVVGKNNCFKLALWRILSKHTEKHGTFQIMWKKVRARGHPVRILAGSLNAMKSVAGCRAMLHNISPGCG